MADWIPILATDVVNALQAPELDALRTAALADTQGDPINSAIATVTPRIRGYVASRPGNKIDLDATLIPPELFQDGVWIVIEALKVRLGDAIPFSDAQKTLLRRAEDDLQRVALGTLRISKPQNPEVDSSIQGGGGAEIAAGRTRLFGDMSGYAGQAQLNTLDGLGITDGVSTNGHYVDPPWLVSFPWQWLSNKPTTAAAAGITDSVVTGGSYADPGWLNLSIAKITGLAAALAACLTTASAASTYLSQANAASTYLTIANAASTYATIANPSHTGGMTLAYGTATTALSPLTITQTWNGSGAVFPGIVFNATDTLSAAASLFLDLQISGSSKLSIAKSGKIVGNGANPYLFLDNAAGSQLGYGTGILNNGGSSLTWSAGGTEVQRVDSAGLVSVANGGGYQWSSTSASSGTKDLIILRHAAGIVAQRNGANAQGYRIYNTYNGTNDEFLTIDFTTTANTATIGVKQTGTGIQRGLNIDAASYNLAIAGSQVLQIGGGNFNPYADLGLSLGTTALRYNNLCAKTILASGSVDAITVKNTTTSGWSDIIFADSSGTNKEGIGFGNSTASVFASLMVFQAVNVDLAIYGGASGTTENFRFNSAGGVTLPKTITAAGTTGAQTINKPAGAVNFAAAATSLVVTNSLVTVNSVVKCQLATNDTTAVLGAVVKAAGSFTIFMKTAPTAETRVDFVVATL